MLINGVSEYKLLKVFTIEYLYEYPASTKKQIFAALCYKYNNFELKENTFNRWFAKFINKGYIKKVGQIKNPRGGDIHTYDLFPSKVNYVQNGALEEYKKKYGVF